MQSELRLNYLFKLAKHRKQKRVNPLLFTVLSKLKQG